jgi:hypothetical protein
MEAEEAIPDLVRVLFQENVGGPNRLLLAEGIKDDEATPGLVTAKEVEGRTPPPTTLHLHPPGLYRHRRGRTTVGGGRVEFLSYMSVEIFAAVSLPDIPRRQRNQLLKEDEEGGQWIFFHLLSRFPTPLSGFCIERSDDFFGEDRHQTLGLATAIFLVTRIEVRILNDPRGGSDVWSRAMGIALKGGHRGSIDLSG